MHVYRTTKDVALGIDCDARTEKHFFEKSSFFRLFYLFTMCGVIGFIGETIWCLVLYGEYRYCGSMLYGPINIIYGFGGLMFYFCLIKFLDANKVIIFTAGMILGCSVEYLASFIQEAALGTVSWDYSNMPLNIGGRTCAQLGMIWGLLAVMWVSVLYPGFEKIMRKIPDFPGRFAAICIIIVLVIDIGLSLTAVVRWQKRMAKIPAISVIDKMMDRHYPDAHMEYIFKSMKHE